ncbi:MAG TPA: DUF481 domain-containing protein, partial [Candidatus Marinimicrobia bacterium]|nr:DUF481 domain-containing protein [Candidatus Neomarinimicrobiota bacterium]
MKHFTIIIIMLSIAIAEPISFKLSGSYYGRRGNLDYHYLNGSFSLSKYGHVQLGGLSLPDTEFLFAADRAKSTYDDEPYEDNGSATLLLDLFANQKFSPFIFAELKFDSLYALDSRTNIGAGGKYRFGPYFSVSYAALYEQEKYTDDATATILYRHSFRPKYKRNFESLGLFIDWQIFYKPKFDDSNEYLLNNVVILSFQTFHEALTLDISYNYKFNSRYKLENVIKSYEYSIDDSLGYYFVDDYLYFYDTDEIPFDYTTDSDGYVMIPSEYYKPKDYTVSIGLSF